MKFIKRNWPIILLLLIALYFRTFNINWDDGMHLHPDERAIIMAVTNLVFPTSLQAFFTPLSTWNPHFFAYGSLPMYLLKILSNVVGPYNYLLTMYSEINLLGRFISALFDSATVFLIFILGKKIINKRVGFLAAIFYMLSVLPIQLSHFYAVDTLLTFFTTLTLYLIVSYYEKPSSLLALFIGAVFGLALATKDSALVLIIAFAIAISSDFLLVFIKAPHKAHLWGGPMKHMFLKLVTDGVIILETAFLVFMICEPYAFISFPEFLNQTQQQAAMTHDAFVFPYTLQYVGIIPYWYELKNIFLWGQGPILALLSFLGTAFVTWKIWHKQKQDKWAQELILLAFFLSYFAVVGHFAIGFVRYMLPLYPLLCLFAAVFTMWFIVKLFGPAKKLIATAYFVLFIAINIWPLSFLAIYEKPNTRIQASNWIYQHVPQNKILAVEHWDDQLPIGQPMQYQTLILPLYDVDTPEKWQGINKTLSQTDYIIIASNRLYVPLMKLTDCKKLYPHPCYKETAQYYQNLFNGKLGFKKIAEFTSYPTVPILNIPINDQGADESFTVYDHPKIMIFKKTSIKS